MNKITLLLQDKEVINELAQDPDVQIRIKDAIIDGIKLRSLKHFNVVEDKIKEEMIRELFDGSWQQRFRVKYQEKIKEGVKPLVSEIISEAQTCCFERINESFSELYNMVRDRLDSLDIEQLIREEAQKVIEKKFRTK